MLEETTINKLIEMRFTAMADAFRIYRTDLKMRELPPEDFFGMLVDAEYTSRKNNRLKRLIRNAELEQRTACIADIDYASGRKLNKTLIKNIFEVIHKRCGHGSLILCSQFREEGWYDRLGVKESPLADAIMDRIKHTAYQINIASKDPAKDISMREIYGLSPTERE